MRKKRVILGTRGSRLARAQAAIVARRIESAFPGLCVEEKVIVTGGDRDRTSSLASIGGKGIFIRELESALLDNTVDMAVHSFKDVTSQLAPSLMLGAFLAPESVRDVMVTRENIPFEKLAPGSLIGTGSMRREALLARLRPDLRIVHIRGNVETRIAKVDRGEYDGVMLSEAGLIRLGLSERASVRFDPDLFYPAPGQGVITVEIRRDDSELAGICAAAGDEARRPVSEAELALLGTIGFDCRTPLGVHGTLDAGVVTLRGFFVDEQSGRFTEAAASGSAADPADVGRRLAELLRAGAGD